MTNSRMSGRRMSKKVVPGRSQGGRRRSLAAPHIEPRLHPTSAGFMGVLTGFSFTKVQHTVHANIYTHLHNRFHVNRFVMHPEIRGERRCCRELSTMARRSSFFSCREAVNTQKLKRQVWRNVCRGRRVSGRLLRSPLNCPPQFKL